MLMTLHLIISITTGLVVLYADEQALAWFLGKRALFHAGTMEFLHRAVAGGLALLLLTGGLLYAKAPQTFLSTPAFDVKMVMVFALICNTYFIERFSYIAVTRPYASTSSRERALLFASGAVSFIGWVTAFACGFLIS